jgi:hypothetical protein
MKKPVGFRYFNVWGRTFFNHKEHKEDSKGTKLKSYISSLCVLCEIPL